MHNHFDIEYPEISYRVVAQNAFAFAFLNYTPIVPGHVLICPRRVVTTIAELTPQELEAILELQQAVSIALTKTLDAQGFNYAWNEGSLAGQTVPHFHLHVVPRKVGDAGILGYDPRQFLYRPGVRPTSPQEELENITDLIRKHMPPHTV